jgi:hypothetical protein
MLSWHGRWQRQAGDRRLRNGEPPQAARRRRPATELLSYLPSVLQGALHEFLRFFSR